MTGGGLVSFAGVPLFFAMLHWQNRQERDNAARESALDGMRSELGQVMDAGHMSVYSFNGRGGATDLELATSQAPSVPLSFTALTPACAPVVGGVRPTEGCPAHTVWNGR
jgi:hypothetical protein